MKRVITAAYEYWGSGCSSLYLASVDGQERVDNFVEEHYKSNTFAQLRWFSNEADAIVSYDAVIEYQDY